MSALNRRTVIAAAASVAALGAATPAIADRQSRFAEVVAAFDAARATFLEAIEVEEAAEQALHSLERRDLILGPKIGTGRHEVLGRDADEAYDHQEREIAAMGRKLRKDLEAIGADTSVVDAWELKATEEAQAAVAEWSRRRAACGYTAASEAVMAAMDAETDALLAVLAYRPVSPEDARAKALWIIERLGRHEISGLHGAFEPLLESLLPEGEELHEQENGAWIIATVEAVS